MSKPLLVPHEVASKALVGALRPLVGKGKPHTPESIEAETGLRARSLYSYTNEDRLPTFEKYLTLKRHLGAPFANRAEAPAGMLSVMAFAAQSCDPRAAVGSMGACIAQTMAITADEIILPAEARDTLPLVEASIAELMAYAQRLRAIAAAGGRARLAQPLPPTLSPSRLLERAGAAPIEQPNLQEPAHG